MVVIVLVSVLDTEDRLTVYPVIMPFLSAGKGGSQARDIVVTPVEMAVND